MIDEKLLLDRIEDFFCADCSLCGGHCRLEHLVDIIKTTPQADKWIPCSERLPNIGDTVLFVDEYALYEVGTVLEHEERMVLENSYGYREDIEDYIAWQPLPKPYKKEGAE